jgi:hypothetical protein
MRTMPRVALACALVLIPAGASRVHAAWDGVFQVCCGHCRSSGYGPCASCYPPGGPVTCYTVRPRCGPIRRLLGLCRPSVTVCRPSCPCPPAPSCYPPAPCPPAPCVPPSASVLAPPAPAYYAAPPDQGPPVSQAPPPPPYVPPPVTEPRVPPGPGGLEPGPNPVDPPDPRSAVPPVWGSRYRPIHPLAPVAPRQLTPPLPPPPVRLDCIASAPVRRTEVKGRLVAAHKAVDSDREAGEASARKN